MPRRLAIRRRGLGRISRSERPKTQPMLLRSHRAFRRRAPQAPALSMGSRTRPGLVLEGQHSTAQLARDSLRYAVLGDGCTGGRAGGSLSPPRAMPWNWPQDSLDASSLARALVLPRPGGLSGPGFPLSRTASLRKLGRKSPPPQHVGLAWHNVSLPLTALCGDPPENRQLRWLGSRLPWQDGTPFPQGCPIPAEPVVTFRPRRSAIASGVPEDQNCMRKMARRKGQRSN